MLSPALVSAALSLSVLTAPAPAVEPDPGRDDPLQAAAQEALSEVRGLLDGVLGSLTADGQHDDLTMALKDLALLKDELPAADRKAAERLLARPTDETGDEFEPRYRVEEATPECNDVVCVHYVTSTGDAVPSADADGDDVPDYVEQALDTLTEVHEAYVEAGYRPPKSDEDAKSNGGNELPDVYLANVGNQGVYGYCASDQPLAPSEPQDAWAFCVLDNDYTEFPGLTPTENFRVTAAHEYFHAVQYAYDLGEDRWLMESTATWAEDEVYDDIDDNVQFLRGGPMRKPHESLDQASGTFHYGSWIFWRYLTERFPTAEGELPTLVREVWERLDDAPGGVGDYSLEGLRKELQQRGLPLTEAFARFSAANRTPGESYEEGKENRYPKARLVDSVRLSQKVRRHALPITLDHLAAGTVRYQPSGSLVSKAWRLRLKLDMTARWKGTAAVLTIKPKSGAPRTKWVDLDKDGNGKQVLNFSARKNTWVEVTLAHASDDFRCNRGTVFSCFGKPKFDDAVQRLDARIYKAG